MTLSLVLTAGYVLGLGFNLFALIAFAAAFAVSCLLGVSSFGAGQPVTTLVACLATLQLGYAAGLATLIYAGRRRQPDFEA